MKKLIAFGLSVLLLASVLAGCDTPFGDWIQNGGSPTGTAAYEYIKDGSTYKLTINQSKAVYTPVSGDKYILLIITGGQTKTSSGTVIDFSDSVFTLKPSNSTITFTVQMSGNTIIKISGTITLEGSGGSVDGPDIGSEGDGTNLDKVSVTGVSLKQSTSLVVGEMETLVASVAPSNATNKNVTWSSSKTTVASVSTSGTVTAVSPGTATITVTTVDGGKTADCTVTVSSGSNPGEGNSVTFTSIADFRAWLSAQPSNDPSTSYNVKLNVSALIGILEALLANDTKYVSLDLSGSTIKSIPDIAFYNKSIGEGCYTLTGISIPDSVTQIGTLAFFTCDSLTSVTFEGTIASGNFGENNSAFSGDLVAKYLAGGKGTYKITSNPGQYNAVWTKQ